MRKFISENKKTLAVIGGGIIAVIGIFAAITKAVRYKIVK